MKIEQRAILIQLLDKWKDGRCTMWSYSPSLSKSVLRLEKDSLFGNLHLICLGTKYICGEIKWGNAQLEFEDVGCVCLRDNEAGFLLNCDIVVPEENVEPIFSRP